MPRHKEKHLEGELLRRYQEGAKLGYRASRFYQLYMPHCEHYVGGIKAVQRVLRHAPTAGYEFVKKHGRMDLAIENLVLDPQWTHLFTEEDRAIARRTLEQEISH